MNINQKKLLLHYSYLSLELEEVLEVCLSVEKEIRDCMEKKYPDYYKSKLNNKKTNNKKDKEEIKSINKIKNKDMKIIYRKIARKVHPDKESGNHDLFSKAAKAYSEQDIGKLLEVAAEVNIKISSLSDESVTILKENISYLDKQIKSKKNSTAWHWYHSDSEDKKEQILKHIFNHKGE